MKRTLARSALAGFFLAVLLAAAVFGNAGSQGTYASDASSAFAEPGPTPTYVSELAPAVAIAPQQPEELPRSGVGFPAPVPWPSAAGVALALVGCFFIHTALTLRTDDAA